jgi:hypothetical protein
MRIRDGVGEQVMKPGAMMDTNPPLGYTMNMKVWILVRSTTRMGGPAATAVGYPPVDKRYWTPVKPHDMNDEPTNLAAHIGEDIGENTRRPGMATATDRIADTGYQVLVRPLSMGNKIKVIIRSKLTVLMNKNIEDADKKGSREPGMGMTSARTEHKADWEDMMKHSAVNTRSKGKERQRLQRRVERVLMITLITNEASMSERAMAMNEGTANVRRKAKLRVADRMVDTDAGGSQTSPDLPPRTEGRLHRRGPDRDMTARAMKRLPTSTRAARRVVTTTELNKPTKGRERMAAPLLPSTRAQQG